MRSSTNEGRRSDFFHEKLIQKSQHIFSEHRGIQQQQYLLHGLHSAVLPICRSEHQPRRGFRILVLGQSHNLKLLPRIISQQKRLIPCFWFLKSKKRLTFSKLWSLVMPLEIWFSGFTRSPLESLTASHKQKAPFYKNVYTDNERSNDHTKILQVEQTENNQKERKTKTEHTTRQHKMGHEAVFGPAGFVAARPVSKFCSRFVISPKSPLHLMLSQNTHTHTNKHTWQQLVNMHELLIASHESNTLTLLLRGARNEQVYMQWSLLWNWNCSLRWDKIFFSVSMNNAHEQTTTK